MGTLTPYLQQQFSHFCPSGWTCRHEVPLLSPDLETLLGYKSRVDVLLERTDGSRRLWIEFEISRADPVANHAKFATAHLFQPQSASDCFIAMVSSHVTRGRRNLAANTISLMRHIGMSAFQTLLFPYLSGEGIKRLNHLDPEAIRQEGLDVRLEIERAFAVSDPILPTSDHRIHFAGDMLEVMLNLRQWHVDLSTPAGRAQWGCRTITYFVYDPKFKRFAPSKFCAYLAVQSTPLSSAPLPPQMTV